MQSLPLALARTPFPPCQCGVCVVVLLSRSSRGVAWTLLVSPRACYSLTGRRLTVLWATHGFSHNPCPSSYGSHASPRRAQIPLYCPCVFLPARPGPLVRLGCHRVAQNFLSHNRVVISASCGLCPARQPGWGSTLKCPCVFLLPAAGEYLSSGKAHESPSKAGGARQQPVL